MKSLEIYKKIFMIRNAENKLEELFSKGYVHGTAHFCIGQEFIPVIISYYLTKNDSVTSTHRGHGHALAKGLSIREFFAELMGRPEGYNKGKGGSQHVFCTSHNYYANGITGGMVPIANGLAFAEKYKDRGNIVIAFFGDGAMNEGYVQEALNFASVMQLPVLFVCENNLYAMSTHTEKAFNSEIYKRGASFGIKSFCINDNDYKELDNIMSTIMPKIRKSIPHFIEVRTYRHKGHSKNDKNLYRNKKEENEWLEKDVMLKLRKDLVDSKKISLSEIKNIENTIKKKIDKEVEKLLKNY